MNRTETKESSYWLHDNTFYFGEARADFLEREHGS